MLSPDNVVEQAKKYSPLVAKWWVVLIQGLVIGALGIYLIRNPEAAKENFAIGVAFYFYSMGLVDITRLRVLPKTTASRIAYYRAILAAVVGGLFMVLLIFNVIVSDAMRGNLAWLLGAATLIYGAAGLYLAFAAKQRGSGRLLSIIASVMFIALGFATIFLEGQNVVDGWVGPVLILLGVGLIGMSIYRYTQTKRENEEAAAAASTAAAGAATAAAIDAPAATAPASVAASPSSAAASPSAAAASDAAAAAKQETSE